VSPDDGSEATLRPIAEATCCLLLHRGQPRGGRRRARRGWNVGAFRMAEAGDDALADPSCPGGRLAGASCTGRIGLNVEDDVVGVVGIPANAAATPVTPDPNWSSPSAWRVREATMCAVAPRVSPTLQMHYIPRSFGALAAQSRRNEAETERFLHERTRSASTIGIVI
jgi:hypothetical protein